MHEEAAGSGGQTPVRDAERTKMFQLLQPFLPGETFGNAVDLGNGTTASYNGSTVMYANSYDYKCDAPGSSGPEQIFTWTASVSGPVHLSLCTSTYMLGAINILDANQTILDCSSSWTMPECLSGQGAIMRT